MSDAHNFNLNDADGGRAYIGHLFQTVLKRHDYRQYIAERLAGDFACTLAQHFEDIKAREAALQQRLTAADERADRLESGIQWESDRNALLLASLTEAEDMLSVTSLEAGQRIDVLEGLLREWIGPGVRSVSHMLSLQTRTNAALKPAEGGSEEAMSFAQIAQFNDDNDHCPERDE